MGKSRVGLIVSALTLGVIAQAASSRAQADPISFAAGDLVVSVEGNGSGTASQGTIATGNTGASANTYLDNEAAPLTLYEFNTTGTNQTPVESIMLPQAASGANNPISGEYGSSSEGTLELSGNGQYLTIAGYAVNAATYNADPQGYGGTTKSCLGPINPCFPLGQTSSVTGFASSSEATAAGDTSSTVIAVPRVIALIGGAAGIDTSTALYGVFNENNPRSVYTVNGSSFYISGEGLKGDNTGGVFYTTLGSSTATSITGNDAGTNESQDTREVQVYNGQLYVSSDSTTGSTNRSYIGTLGSAGSLPTSVANSGNGPTQLPGTGTSTGKETITSGPNSNGNGLNTGLQINLSPDNFVFADNGTVMYVADSGSPKQTSASSPNGDGGLQKWSLVGYTLNNGVPVGGTWQLDYTLAVGLNLVLDSASSGTTGLYGLAGEEVTINGQAEEELFATNYTIGDTDPTYLYGITDLLSATTNPNVADPGSEDFTVLATAPADSDFKGVAFAPVPEPASLALLATGLLGVGAVRRRKKG